MLNTCRLAMIPTPQILERTPFSKPVLQTMPTSQSTNKVPDVNIDSSTAAK